MRTHTTNQHIIETYDNNLEIAISQFIMDRQSTGKSPNTIKSYKILLGHFTQYCESQSLKTVEQTTPQFIQTYLMYLDGKGHNRNGVLAYFRTIRAFYNWYYWFNGLNDWDNPFKHIRAPKKDNTILDPITDDQIKALLTTCKRDDSFIDSRDRAIILTLAGTGIRAFELCNIERSNVNDAKNQIYIPHGKGDKSRFVFYMRDTKLAINRYLRNHAKSEKWLFTNQMGDKLTFSALRQMIQRRAKDAGIGKVKVHAFRRHFTLNALNNGMDLLSLSRILGHKDTNLLAIYAKQSPDNLQAKFLEAFSKNR
jgi:integrase/recombinase XerD